MNNINISIIGMGPRGLAILERIIAHEQENKTAGMYILVFESGIPGVGCHDIYQAEHLLVNTVASQITVFSDESVRNVECILAGPSFYEWLVQFGNDYNIVKPDPDAYYPRRIFGQYLNWCYGYLLSKKPDHISVKHVKSNIQNLEILPNEQINLTTSENICYESDYVFITTGHTPKKMDNIDCAIVNDVYPIKEKLQHITNNHVIAIEGWGLTAFDVISELSIGRNGKFERTENGRLTYHESGYEPKIHIFSRSGIPLSARAINQKDVSGQYKPRFFTYKYIDSLRSKLKQLDFEKNILPVLILEMEYVYYKTYFGINKIKFNVKEFDRAFENLKNDATSKHLIFDIVPLQDRFSWGNLVDPIPKDALLCQDKFEEWLSKFLESDVQEARKGNIDSPIKAATDVLRDIRDILRYSIDFRGLTEHSHRKLYHKYVPIMNRLAVGPPKERLEEILALKEVGIITYHRPRTHVISKEQGLFLVSHSQEELHRIDSLLRARISIHSPIEDGSQLTQNLLQNGIVQLYYNGEFHPGGIELSRQFNVITPQNKVIDNIYVLGMLAEGIKFYTFIVPRPGVNSTAISDAGTAVSNMLNKIKLRGFNE